jgi:hypothetical protein
MELEGLAKLLHQIVKAPSRIGCQLAFRYAPLANYHFPLSHLNLLNFKPYSNHRHQIRLR